MPDFLLLTPYGVEKGCLLFNNSEEVKCSGCGRKAEQALHWVVIASIVPRANQPWVDGHKREKSYGAVHGGPDGPAMC